ALAVISTFVPASIVTFPVALILMSFGLSSVMPPVWSSTLLLVSSWIRIDLLLSSMTILLLAGVISVIVFVSSWKISFSLLRVMIALVLFSPVSVYGGLRLLLYRLPRMTGFEGSSLMKPRITSSPISGMKK